MTHPNIIPETIPAELDNTIPFIQGVNQIAGEYDAFILDIFGVLHDGVKRFKGTVDCLSHLKTLDKKVCLVSNTPRRRHEVREDLIKLGIEPLLYDDIVTAGDSAHLVLREKSGQTCWFAGTERFKGLLKDTGVTAMDSAEEADFILNAISGTYEVSSDKIREDLTEAKKRNLPMLCANPDLVVNIGDEQHICAGTYALMYENMGGEVQYHGKPYPPIYEEAWTRLGNPGKNRVVAIGDSLHTDIQGASRFGVDSIFNLVGIHWEEVRMSHKPGDADMNKVMSVIKQQPHRPTTIINGFKW